MASDATDDHRFSWAQAWQRVGSRALVAERG